MGCCSACLARSRLPSLRPIIKVSPGGHPYVTPQPAASAPALAAPPPQRIHGLHYCDYLNPSRTEWAGPPDIRRITLPAGSTSFLALIDIIADRIGVSVTDVLSYVDSAGDKITVIIFFLAPVEKESRFHLEGVCSCPCTLSTNARANHQPHHHQTQLRRRRRRRRQLNTAAARTTP